MNKRIFLISHGRLAEGMADTLQMLVGDVANVETFGLMPGESPETIASAIEQVILQNPEDRIIIAADLLGGSVSNAATRLVRYPNVRMFNGMNLALVLGLYFAETDTADEKELENVLDDARAALGRATLFRSDEPADEDDIL